MPSISNAPSDDLYEPFQSFSIINGDNLTSSGLLRPSGQLFVKPFDKENNAYRTHRNVNVVKPVLRTNDRPKAEELPTVEDGDRVEEVDARRNPIRLADEAGRGRKRQRKTMETLAQSQTILDPKFSRNLDLKLRRLKEKEIIAERLTRRSKERAKVVSGGIPKLNIQSVPANVRKISVSNPNVTLIKPTVINLKMEDPKKENVIEAKNVRKTFAAVDGKTPDNLDVPGGRSRRTTRSNESIAAASRPLFVTTVRKGQFLPPPPEMATLLGLEGYVVETPALYSYSSRPKVVGNNAQKPVGSLSPLATTKETDSVQNSNDQKGFENAARSLAILTGLAAGAAGLPSG